MDMDNLVEPWINSSECEAIVVKNCAGTVCDLTNMYISTRSFTATVPQSTDIIRTQYTKFHLCSAS
jgi:hypothetical protein